MERSPCVFLVDDDPAVLDSLGLLIKTAGLKYATFSSAESFIEAYTLNQPGCLVLDLKLTEDMNRMNGIDLQEELRKRNISLPIIFLSAHGTIPTSVRAIKAGAIDFLVKPPSPQVLLERIQEAILQNVRWHERHPILPINNKPFHLTKRELEIAKLLVKGYTNKEIARQLSISPRTVENHRARLKEKSQTHNLVELAHLIENMEESDN